MLIHVRALQLALRQERVSKELDIVRSDSLNFEPTLVRVERQFIAHFPEALRLFTQDKFERAILVSKKFLAMALQVVEVRRCALPLIEGLFEELLLA